MRPVLLAALFATALNAQQDLFTYNPPGAPKPSDPASLPLPSVIHVCGGSGCQTGRGGTLILENGKYHDPSSPGYFMTFEKFTRDSVIITREDVPPNPPGKAVYTGRLSPDGNSIVDGMGQWTWRSSGALGNPAPFKMAWGSAIDTVPGGKNSAPAMGSIPTEEFHDGTLPAQIRFCGAHCYTVALEGGHYVNSAPDPRNPAWHSTWTIEKFTKASVIFKRVDSNNGKPVFTSTYTGQVAPEGNRLVNILGDGVNNANLRIAWGKALDSLPANDAELRQQNPQMSPALDPNGNTLGSIIAFFFGAFSSNSAPSADGIDRLESALDNARSACSNSRDDLDACAKKREIEYKLSQAREQLAHEINQLQEARDALQPKCNAGDKEACDQLTEVNDRLHKDGAN